MVSSAAGDTLTVSNVAPAGFDPNDMFDVQTTEGTIDCYTSVFVYSDNKYAFCADIAFNDSVTGNQTTENNVQSDAVYDACGTLVDQKYSYSWGIVGKTYLLPGRIGSTSTTIPWTGVCFGQWTVVYTYSQTFTDGVTLSDTAVATFPVTPTRGEAVVAQYPQAALVGGSVSASEELGGCARGHATQASATNYPVDTVTGNFWHTFADLSTPGRGPSLDLSRTYNSLAAGTDGPFGYGWTDSYGISLTADASTAVVSEENGAQVTFTSNAGSWSAPPRAVATLVHNGDGTWTFTRQARQIITFDANGQLTAVRDLNGLTTTISHPDGSTMVVQDPAGRSYTFSFAGAHVTSVRDSSTPARTLTYGYDAAGNLTDVVDVGGGHWQFTYDDSHRLVTMRSPRFCGDVTTSPTPVTTNHYDAAGRVDWQSDPLGRTTSFDYTSMPSATKVTDPAGNITVYGNQFGMTTFVTHGYGTQAAATTYYRYDPTSVGKTVVVDPDGNLTQQVVDPSGNVLSSTDPLNRTTSYTYNALNEVTSITEPKTINGQPITTTMTYDAAGNLLTRSAPLLDNTTGATVAISTTTFHHDDPSHPGDVTSVTDPNGNTTTTAYDAFGDVTAVTAPATPENSAGDKTTYGYDTGRGLRTSMVSPKGNITGGNPAANTTTYAYDAYGRPTITRDPLWTASTPTAHQVVEHYDADGNQDWSTDGDGHTTTYVHDAAGQLTATQRPDGTTLRTDYWADGSVHHQYDAAGNATAYTYDAAGHQRTVTDALNRTTSYVYDPNGLLLTLTDPSGRTTTTTYDQAGEVTGVTYSDSGTPAVFSIYYDADGQLTAQNDGSGQPTWTWDSLHRLIATKNGNGQTVAYGYDLGGRLTSITYPGTTGTVTRSYDAANRLTGVKDWAKHQTTFGYDPNSNLTTQTNPNGTTDSQTFDAANRLMAISDAPTGTPTAPFAAFGYTRDGANLATAVSSTGVPADSHAWSYSTLNQLSGVDAATYAYDQADNLTKRLDNTAQSFDAADELTGTTAPAISLVGTASAGDATSSSLSMSLPSGTTAGDQVLVVATLPNGKTITGPTGYATVGTYTSGTGSTATKIVVFDHTVTATDGPVVTVSFQGKIAKSVAVAVYRGVDPTTPIDVTASASTTAGTAVTVPSVTSSLTGEQLVMVDGSASTAGTWSAPTGMTRRVQQAGGTTDTAILDQPLATAGATGTRTATHSVSTQLVGVLLALRPAGQASCGYDPQGNRTTVTTPSGTTTLTYYQSGQLDQYGTTAYYRYDGDGLRSSKTNYSTGVTTNYTWDLTSSIPLLLVDGTTSYIYGPGGLPLEQVTSGGAVLYYHHDQLGSTRALTNATGTVVATYSYDPYGNLTGTTGTAANPFGYAGQYTDPESGLIHLRARYYDPTTAQFLTRDPLAAVTGSAYGYVNDNPLNGSDPSGLCTSNVFSAGFWGDGNCLSGLVGGPTGDGGESFGGVVKSVAGITGASAAVVGVIATGGIGFGATEVFAGDAVVTIGADGSWGWISGTAASADAGAEVSYYTGIASGLASGGVDCTERAWAACGWDAASTAIGFGVTQWPGGPTAGWLGIPLAYPWDTVWNSCEHH